MEITPKQLKSIIEAVRKEIIEQVDLYLDECNTIEDKGNEGLAIVEQSHIKEVLDEYNIPFNIIINELDKN